MLDRGMTTFFRRGVPLARRDLFRSRHRACEGSSRGYSGQTRTPEPLRLSGAIKSYKHVEMTPVVGTEFLEGSLAEMMSGPNSDELIKDLAITISRRGVVMFRNQNDLTKDIQKALMQRMGELTGKPKESTLSIHVMLNPERIDGGKDVNLSTISSRQRKAAFKTWVPKDIGTVRQDISQWHSDIAMEPVPSDYTCLRLTELPTTGGDTMFASSYEVYDRLSKPMQKFLEGLNATYDAPFFTQLTKLGHKIYEKPRGHPDNIGTALSCVHPVIRTNPVTGWKAVFALGAFVKSINGLTPTESEMILQWLMDVVNRNHDLQCRLRWKGKNDIAIWDNRSVIHQPLFDYDLYGERFGWRVSATGEHPFLDPNSLSRRDALEIEGNIM